MVIGMYSTEERGTHTHCNAIFLQTELYSKAEWHSSSEVQGKVD